jgi:hypothetical protein
MRRRKSFLIAGIIIALIAFAFFGAMLGAGSYGYAEQYQFKIKQDSLIKVIKKLKENTRNFNHPDSLDDGDYMDTSNLHYNVSVYDYEKQVIFSFFVDADNDNPINTNIYLVSVNKTFDSNYKMVNRDMDRAENLQVKRDFERNILDKLNIKYTDKGNNNFVFWK